MINLYKKRLDRGIQGPHTVKEKRQRRKESAGP